ncbi:MAG: hypothetical protein QNJ12_08490 [Ilumatobacter sp.]|uniref:hypothetical protein n=1 Tax=Ilumatobacter sp. TaxID=1967498 RepID=UPI00262F1FEC|nr:hypothetical protein [Ilumatobacter sp.]MDJ0768818.1 hypothetical protein [Ilumatobacter sp.]
MPFVNKSGGDGEEESTDVAAGAPPLFDVEFDPNDPAQTKVHYNLTGWSIDQRAELAETLAEVGVPHVWEGEELVVPEAVEEGVDRLFDELEAEIGPFPVPLLEGQASTEFGLDEWPFGDIEMLKESLVDAEIPHAWEGRRLIVAQDAEHVVDDLLDAIEAGEVASLDEETEAPDGALHDLYRAADQLARDITHGRARKAVLDLVPRLSPNAPPFGLAVGAWASIVQRGQDLVYLFEAGADPEQLLEKASELRDVARPYV